MTKKTKHIIILSIFIYVALISIALAQSPPCPGTCTDEDGDGYTPDTTCNANMTCMSCKCGDCNDIFPDGYTINPGRPEDCDNNFDIDENCNGLINCHDAGCCGSGYCPNAPDDDGDGYTVCTGDCNDIFPDGYTTNPGRPEECDDSFDNNCNGLTDCQDAACCGSIYCPETWVDNDNDTYTACEGDCNDMNANIHLNAPEICNDELDNDCDTSIDCPDSDCAGNPNCPEIPEFPPGLGYIIPILITLVTVYKLN